MEYFTVLNLKREPFSNSPDPELFFQARQHVDCLQQLELSLRLRRGLNVVIGEVGTGKTTLCRQIIRRFDDDADFETHLILDPSFSTPSEFLAAVAEMFTQRKPRQDADEWQMKEIIKQHLFRRGVDEGCIITLIIDEGQKIPLFCLEILREFLNYETNAFKLLQIVIFAQKEFEKTITDHPNFADRINLHHRLGPLSFADARSMIQYRLSRSSEPSQPTLRFTRPALRALYRATGGYPRKIIHLCHRCLLTMIIQNRSKVSWSIVRSSARRVFPSQPTRKRLPAAAAVAAALLIAAVAAAVWTPQSLVLPLWHRHSPTAAVPGPPSNGPPGAVLQTAAAPQESAPAAAPAQPPPATKVATPESAAAAKDLRPDTVPAAGAPDASSLSRPVPSELAAPPPIVFRPPSRFVATRSPAAAAPAERVETTPSFASRSPEKVAAAPSVSPVRRESPAMLGTVIVHKWESLSHLITRVYGTYSPRYLRLVLMANPDIRNPNRIDVGQQILMPAIPVSVTSLPIEVWWVQLDAAGSLTDALGKMRTTPLKFPGIRLVPYWNPDKGLNFPLVLGNYYLDRGSAQKRLKALPAAENRESRLVSLWHPDNLYFADPFFGQ